MDELQTLCSAIKVDVIALTETWLSDMVSDRQICLLHYSKPFGKDRKGRIGGGVCCYIRNDIAWSQFIECLWLHLSSFDITLAILYCRLLNMTKSQTRLYHGRFGQMQFVISRRFQSYEN